MSLLSFWFCYKSVSVECIIYIYGHGWSKKWLSLLHRSITIATPKGEVPDMKMLALFGCGSVILRGVGCTVNDILDRDIDKKVVYVSSKSSFIYYIILFS
jgi:4-hydroxybenzoate polyprenyltransferase